MLEKYEKLLSRELTDEASAPASAPSGQETKSLDETENEISVVGSKDRESQLAHIIAKGLKQLDSRKLAFTVAGHQIVVKDQIQQAAALVQWAKTWADGAVQASPQASMAWTVVCVAIPLLTLPICAEEANAKGFTYVTTRSKYYIALETTLVPRSLSTNVGVQPQSYRSEFEERIVDLYRHILDFQIKSVLRFYRNAFGNYGRDLLQREDWKVMLADIEEIEKTLKEDSDMMNTAASKQELEQMADIAGQSLTSLAELLRLDTRQLAIQEKMLEANEMRDARAISKEENECIKSFHIQNRDQNQSYQWYKDRIEERIENTCGWFLSQDQYQKWLSEDTGPLLVSGNPGCGKSVLAKYLIDHELDRTSQTICYFFFKDQVQDTLQQAFCALIHQILVPKPSLVRHAFQFWSQSRANEDTRILWRILDNIVHDPETQPIVFVLDALDECNESDFRELLTNLRAQLQDHKQNPINVKYLFTTRPYSQIISKFNGLGTVSPVLHIPGEDESNRIGQEVKTFIEYRVSQLAREQCLSDDIQEHLERELLAIPHQTYLWVFQIFDQLEKKGFKRTKKGVEEAVKALPKTVNETYRRILERSSDHQMLRRTLCIVLAAKRPLAVRELNVALNVSARSSTALSSETYLDLDLEDDSDFASTVRNWCGLFISIDFGKVYFLHQTARDYLISNPVLLSSDSEVSVHQQSLTALEEAHSILTESCVSYLLFVDLTCEPETLD